MSLALRGHSRERIDLKCDWGYSLEGSMQSLAQGLAKAIGVELVEGEKPNWLLG